jgi:CRP-like cAMP-binding protein
MVDADRCPVAIDFYRTDDLFGEASSTGAPEAETCIAMENTQVMMWTTGEIERIAMARPALALTLLQCVIQRSEQYKSRIESFGRDTIPRRLARALVHFSQRFGQEAVGGSVEMNRFTHELLSQYVGAAREAVTIYMNQFRTLGYLRYSRQSIALNGDALKNWLKDGTSPTETATVSTFPSYPQHLLRDC